jgi:Na+/proline symporter
VAVIIHVPALVMSELMGIPLNLSIVAMGGLTALHTTLGGIKAVIWTDTLQVATVILGFTLMATSALAHIPGGIQEVWTMGLAHGKFELFDFSFNFDKVDNFWPLMLGGTLLSVQAMSTDQSVLQKFFTTKSSRETSKSLIFYGAVLIPLITSLYLLGVILFVFYSNHPELRVTLQNPDAVVPHYAANMLPHGLAGVLVASIFAGSMSTVSASINSLATSTVVDVYQRLIEKEQSDEHYTRESLGHALVGRADNGRCFLCLSIGNTCSGVHQNPEFDGRSHSRNLPTWRATQAHWRQRNHCRNNCRFCNSGLLCSVPRCFKLLVLRNWVSEHYSFWFALWRTHHERLEA